MAATLASAASQPPFLTIAFAVPALLPLAAATARHLADSGAHPSGVPASSMNLVGQPLFSQMAEPSRPDPNRFGPNPFEVTQ